ncbi:hypothetical protein ACVWYN_000713 [Pedobacter sp. UYP24]
MMKKIVFVLFLLILTGSTVAPLASAQCAMCAVSAEQSVKNGNKQGLGLNAGIIYLLVIPYILISGIGMLWYMKYRKKAPNYAENV